MKGKTENDEEGAKEVVTLEELKKKMADFAKEREWDQFHTPRNLLLAMKCWQECVRCSYAGVNNFGLLPDTPTQVGEVGELSEIFQWKGEVPRGLPDWAEKEKQHLGEELSDVLLYLVRLSDICGIDLGNAVLRKLELNAIKYPVSLCKGSSKKLTLLSKSTTTTTTTSSSENGVINDGE